MSRIPTCRYQVPGIEPNDVAWLDGIGIRNFALLISRHDLMAVVVPERQPGPRPQPQDRIASAPPPGPRRSLQQLAPSAIAVLSSRLWQSIPSLAILSL